MKTFNAKAETAQHDWYVVDASGKVAFTDRTDAAPFPQTAAVPDPDAAKAPANHSPKFYIDESGLELGLRAMLGVAVDYLQGAKP